MSGLHPLTSPKGSQLPNFQQNPRWGIKDALEHPEPETRAGKTAAGLLCPAQGWSWHILSEVTLEQLQLMHPQNAHFLQLSPIKHSPSPVPVTRRYVPADR